jgi:hypothetical protein
MWRSGQVQTLDNERFHLKQDSTKQFNQWLHLSPTGKSTPSKQQNAPVTDNKTTHPQQREIETIMVLRVRSRAAQTRVTVAFDNERFHLKQDSTE